MKLKETFDYRTLLINHNTWMERLNSVSHKFDTQFLWEKRLYSTCSTFHDERVGVVAHSMNACHVPWPLGLELLAPWDIPYYRGTFQPPPLLPRDLDLLR